MLWSCMASCFSMSKDNRQWSLHVHYKWFLWLTNQVLKAVFNIPMSGSWHPLILVSLQAADVCGECFCTHLLIVMNYVYIVCTIHYRMVTPHSLLLALKDTKTQWKFCWIMELKWTSQTRWVCLLGIVTWTFMQSDITGNLLQFHLIQVVSSWMIYS